MFTSALRSLIILFVCLFFSTSLQAQYNSQQYFDYLESKFDEHDKSLQNFLIDELSHFLVLFPNDANAGRVQYMLASVYRARGKDHEALGGYLKMIFLYPSSAAIAANSDDLRNLLANKRAYRDQEKMLLTVIEHSYADLSTADAYFKYLDVLVSLKQSGMENWGLTSCREFIRRFPNDQRHDQVLLWKADIYIAGKEFHEASAELAKFNALFAGSPHKAEVLYRQGFLNYKHMRRPAEAVELLSTVISDHADNSAAGDALFLIAEIKEKKDKNYEGAIADYSTLVAKYPDNANAVEALWQIAEIQEKRLKEYRTAAGSYGAILEQYSDSPRGVDALEKMALLYKSRLDEYLLAAEAYARIAELFPDHDDAPDRLVDAGDLCNDKLKDYQKAITYYQMAVDNYRDSKAAKSAAKKIEKAQKKLAEE